MDIRAGLEVNSLDLVFLKSVRANPKLRSHPGESTSWTPRERAPPPRGEPEGEPTGAPTCFSFALDFRM